MKYFHPAILFLLAVTVSTAQTRLYVNHAATGANDGSSWADALTDLQAALALAQPGDEVWVAEGTYLPTQTTDRSISFEPRSGLRLYGGFAGHETDPSQRDWEAHPTVLSGDIGTVGDSTDNSLAVVFLLEPDSSTLLDGLVITGGQADDYNTSPVLRGASGGGLYVMGENGDAYPELRNLVLVRNTALGAGGGAMVYGGNNGSVAPRWANCRFERNRVLEGSGGGLAQYGGSWVERGRDLSGCSFLHNVAGYQGGGYFYRDSERNDRLDLYDCTFEGNEAPHFGGGAMLYIGRLIPSGFAVIGSSFNRNRAGVGAGIFVYPRGLLDANYAVMDGCSIIGNTAPFNSFSSAAIVNLDILYDGEITQSFTQVSNNLFRGNHAPKTLLGFFTNTNFIWDRNLLLENSGSILFSASPNKLTPLRLSRTLIAQNEVVQTLMALSSQKGTLIEGFDVQRNLCPTGRYFLFPSVDTLVLRYSTFADNQITLQDNSSSSNHVARVLGCALYGINDKSAFLLRGGKGSEYAYCAFDSLDCASLPPKISCGPGNLFNLDPLFRDTANGDYSLLPCSPLINAGSNAAAAGIPTDLAGNPRILEGTVDIGAYEAPAFALSAAPQVSPACVGTSNGSLSIAPQHGCEPLAYSWSPNAGNGPELQGLPPGAYVVTVTDGSGRQITDTLTVPEAPVPSLSLLAQDVTCGTVTGGSLTASVTGGTAPFGYGWSAGLGDQSQHAGLGPGPYALTVSDANGCLDSASATLALIGNLTLSVGAIPISCHGEADAALTVNPANGAPPFDWDWLGWPGNAPTAAPLGPGLYAVTVTDALGCTAAFAFNPVNAPDPLVLGASGSAQTQSSPPNGAAVVTTTSGGTQPYGYLWDMGQTGNAIGGLAAGTYTVTVTDARGCTATAEVVVELMLSATGEPLGVVLFYPNPAVDWVRALLPESRSAGWRLEVSDASGRVVRSSGCADSDCVLDLSGLASGAYVLTARSRERVLVGRVVKQ